MSDNRAMASVAKKRFYKRVTVAASGAPGTQGEQHFVVELDGRAARTPAGRTLALPRRPLAEAIAEEWARQGETIAPDDMRLTRLANSALDLAQGAEGARDLIAKIVAYAGSDLICYRVEHPQGLVARQAAHWDPILAWASAALGARFHCVAGIVHKPQPRESLARIEAALSRLDAFALVALHEMTTLMGSALLALATARGRLSAAQAWEAAHVDEDWQIEAWGEDAEARARREHRRRDFLAATRFLRLAAPHRPVLREH